MECQTMNWESERLGNFVGIWALDGVKRTDRKWQLRMLDLRLWWWLYGEGLKGHNNWCRSPETRTLQRWMHRVCRKSWPQRFRTARNALGEVAQDAGPLRTVAIPPFVVSTQGLGYWTRDWCRILQVPAKRFPALHKMPVLTASLSHSHSS